MANVNWINGEIVPPTSGEYYVIQEAQLDMKDPDTGEIVYHAGDIEVDGDWYDKEDGCWQSLGKANPYWKVLSWANILRPSIPEDIRFRVKLYFGTRMDGGTGNDAE